MRKRTVPNFLYAGRLLVRLSVCFLPFSIAGITRISNVIMVRVPRSEQGCGVSRIIVSSEQEQEQLSSLYIVQNKYLISSSDSVETKEASDLLI